MLKILVKKKKKKLIEAIQRVESKWFVLLFFLKWNIFMSTSGFFLFLFLISPTKVSSFLLLLVHFNVFCHTR